MNILGANFVDFGQKLTNTAAHELDIVQYLSIALVSSIDFVVDYNNTAIVLLEVICGKEIKLKLNYAPPCHEGVKQTSQSNRRNGLLFATNFNGDGQGHYLDRQML